MSLKIFSNNDNEYLRWMKDRPYSFIVNTFRRENSGYFKLHKSKCRHISTISGLKKGAYTERGYIKIASEDLNELKNWFAKNNANFKGNFSECQTCKPFSEKFIDNPIFLFPELIESDLETLFEGAKQRITINAYERNLKARQQCLEYHGYICCTCKMDFEKAYGIIGKKFIHVHHVKELAAIGKTYMIDPIADLIPVCPNCHAMLHQRKPCFTKEELIKIIAAANKRFCNRAG